MDWKEFVKDNNSPRMSQVRSSFCHCCGSSCFANKGSLTLYGFC